MFPSITTWKELKTADRGQFKKELLYVMNGKMKLSFTE